MFMLCFAIIIIIIIVFPLHVHCIHLARGMMRMRIPSTSPNTVYKVLLATADDFEGGMTYLNTPNPTSGLTVMTHLLEWW